MIKISSAIFKTFFLSLCIVANTHFAFGQTASILPQGYTQYLDSNGKPLSAGKVYNYIPSTTTPKTTWQDAAETIPNANPVILDAGGRAKILGDGSYRQIVKDRNNVTIWDAVTSSTGSGSSSSTATGDGDLVGTIKPWAGMTAPNQYAFTYGQEVSRTTYSALYTAITSSQSVFCASGSPILNGLTDTTNFWVGMSVEISCVAAGFSTIISKTSSTVTLAANANATTNVTAVFYPWGRGNGTTTFNLPDLRGVVPAGNNNMGGVASANLTTTYFGATDPNSSGALGGVQSKTLIAVEIPGHNHPVFLNDPGHNHTTDARTLPGGGTIQSGAGVAGGAAVINSNTTGITVRDTSGGFGTANQTNYSGGGIAVSATLGNTGSGYTNGSQTITVIGGTCTTQPQFTVNVSGNVFTGTPSLLTAGSCTVAPANPAATSGGGGTGGTLNITYSAQPFSLIQPTRTTNYIIKITPDANSATASGVTSLGGMTGDIACGSGLICTGNTVSTVATLNNLIVGSTTISGGSSNGVIFNNGGFVGNTTSANNSVLTTNGSGVPSLNTTLPSALTIPSPAISGGTIDNSVIGGVTPAAGSFTSLTASGNVTVSGDSVVGGYLRVGSLSAPTNTTAGDLTAKRLSIGNATLSVANGQLGTVTGAITATSGTEVAVGINPTISPASASSAGYRTLYMSSGVNSAQNFSADVTAGYFENRIVNAGTLSSLNGARFFGLFAASTSATLGTVTTVNGVLVQAVSSFSNALTATISSTHGVHVVNPANSGSGPLTLTSQAGVTIEGLSAATNNTHLLIGTGTIPSSNWGIYNSSTSPNYMAGALGIGTTSVGGTTGVMFRIGGNATGATSSNGLYNGQIVQSDITSAYNVYLSQPQTAAAAFTLPILRHFSASQSTFGAGSAVTTQYGFVAESNMTGATNNYGFFGNIAAASGRWNFYANGTARNWFGGNVGIAASGYINWGTTDGSAGQGIRQNSNIMQIANTAGTWDNIATNSGTLTNGNCVSINSTGQFVDAGGPCTTGGGGGTVSAATTNQVAVYTAATTVGGVTLNATATPMYLKQTSSGVPSFAQVAFSELNLGTQSANTVLAGPTSGGAATPAYRALVAADIPTTTMVDAVTTYGLVGDDSTNNDSAISTMVTAINSGNLTVYIRPGSYRYSNAWPAITATSGAIVCAQGTKLRSTHATNNGIALGSTTVPSQNFIVSGCTHRPTLVKTGGAAIKIDGGSYIPKIIDNYFEYVYNGIDVAWAANVEIVRPTFRYLVGTFGIRGLGSSGKSISGLSIDTSSADNPYPQTANISQVKAYAALTAFNLGDIVNVNNYIWQVVTAGTTGAASSPSTLPSTNETSPFSSNVTDGTVEWRFVSVNSFTWVLMDSYAYSFIDIHGRWINGVYAYRMQDTVAAATCGQASASCPWWFDVVRSDSDHAFISAAFLASGRGFRGTHIWFGSALSGNAVVEDSTYLGETMINGGEIIGNAQSGVLLNNASGRDSRFTNLAIGLNSQVTSNTYNGITVAANRGDFIVSNNRFGPNNAGTSDSQRCAVSTGGTNANYVVVNNVARGQANGSTSALAYCYGASQTNQINASGGNIAY